MGHNINAHQLGDYRIRYFDIVECNLDLTNKQNEIVVSISLNQKGAYNISLRENKVSCSKEYIAG